MLTLHSSSNVSQNRAKCSVLKLYFSAQLIISEGIFSSRTMNAGKILHIWFISSILFVILKCTLHVCAAPSVSFAADSVIIIWHILASVFFIKSLWPIRLHDPFIHFLLLLLNCGVFRILPNRKCKLVKGIFQNPATKHLFTHNGF